MPSTERTRRLTRRTVWIATALAMAAVIGGWTVAAAFTVQQGNTETGGGAYHGTSSLTYWTETSVGVGSEPSTLPAVISTTVGTPTVLGGAAANYAVNTPVATDVVHFWKFTEAAGAPVSTELELQFTVSTGAGPTITQVTSFVETQATSPGAAIVFTIYYDLGSPASGTITLNSVTEISQTCSAVGNCP
jgi:hypothetical protein